MRRPGCCLLSSVHVVKEMTRDATVEPAAKCQENALFPPQAARSEDISRMRVMQADCSMWASPGRKPDRALTLFFSLFARMGLASAAEPHDLGFLLSRFARPPPP